jgi:serine/threonine-protein phosphatase 2A regulatory subunit A
MQGVDSCIAFAHAIPANKINQNLVPFIKKFAIDKSWRIRYLVADKIMEITNGIGIENAKEHLTSYYCQFLEDVEPEVRTAAVRRLSDFAVILDSKVIIQSIIPSLNKLKTD